jgi:hypothetical protein
LASFYFLKDRFDQSENAFHLGLLVSLVLLLFIVVVDVDAAFEVADLFLVGDFT